MAVSLFGFGIGIILAVFHMLGMVFVLSDMLYICVRNVSALLPRCFRCFMLILLGPVELLLRACFMARCVSTIVMGIGVV